ncbi:MAG: 50S ribosomal protein L4 [Candidatus Omnitrophica bacterium]|jgi:large subunit ribosomal protein L4|nr:50S ribosomal protein L4 [Candidatus Omnitrophota bacterium]MDD5660436.1 50S ribosomal protein L4 [Candidatus Omnitrophota bacterium]
MFTPLENSDKSDKNMHNEAHVGSKASSVKTVKERGSLAGFTLPVYNIEGKEIDTIKLNAAIFDGSQNADCLHQAIENYRANQRKGLASTKTRGEVSGGGRKPWKQKGTGRARVGSTRSPLWRHGGVVFGPHPRDFSYDLPQKIKSAALKTSLNLKLKENNFMILDEFKIEKPKTKLAVGIFSNLKLFSAKEKKEKKVLFLTHKLDPELKKALKNISFLTVDLASNCHAYEVMNSQKLLVTKAAVSDLTSRLKS